MVARWTRVGLAGALALAVAFGPIPAAGTPTPSLEVAIPNAGGDLAPVLSDDGTVTAFLNRQASGASRVTVHDRRSATTVPIPGSEGATSVGISGNGCTIAWPVATVFTPPTTSSTSSSSTTSSSTTSSTAPSSSSSTTSSTTTSSSTTTVAAQPFRPPTAQVQTWRMVVADLCDGDAATVAEIAAGLPFGPLGRPALSWDGATIVVSTGLEVLRFDRAGPAFTQSTVSPPVQQPTARYGSIVDVSDDGSVVVYSAGTDPANPASLSVYRIDGLGAAPVEVSATAHHPSISGDGSTVAFATVAASSTVTVRSGTDASVILDNGTRPQMSGDGHHVVYESGPAVRITSWTGDGTTPFSETATIALNAPVAPTATGPAIDRFGSVVATDSALVGDIELSDIPADAAFASGSYEVAPPSASAPLSAQVVFTNDGPASVGVAAITGSGPITIGNDDCAPVVAPESSCTIEVSFADSASAQTGGTVTLTPIGVFPVPYSVDVRGIATTPTTNPPRVPPNNGGSSSGSGSRPPFYPSFPSSSSSSSSSSSTSSSTSSPSSTSSAAGIAFDPPAFTFSLEDSDPDTGQLTGILEIVNSSSTPVEVLGVRREPVEAVAFQIESTTCTDAVVQPGGRCRVTVGYTIGADGPESAELVATLADGAEVSATLQGADIDPQLTIWPATATTSQVVTVTGSGFQPGVSVQLDWAGGLRDVDVDDQGTFDVPVVVPATARTGTMLATVAAADGRADDVSTSMLVTSATTRRGPTVLEGVGPNIAG